MAWAAAASGGIAAASNRNTNKMRATEARRARDWEAYMSNTARQREVRDLKAAGLNPILAAGGGGASTPNAPVPEVKDPLDGVVASALAAKQMDANIKNLEAVTKNVQAETSNKNFLNEKIGWEISNLMQQNQLLFDQQEHTRASAQGIRLDNVKKDVTADIYDSAAGVATRLLEMGGFGAGSLYQGLKNLTRSGRRTSGASARSRLPQVNTQ